MALVDFRRVSIYLILIKSIAKLNECEYLIFNVRSYHIVHWRETIDTRVLLFSNNLKFSLQNRKRTTKLNDSQ